MNTGLFASPVSLTCFLTSVYDTRLNVLLADATYILEYRAVSAAR